MPTDIIVDTPTGPRVQLGATARGTIQYWVIDPDGSVAREYQRQQNLILDSGLDNLATRRWNQMMLACAAGTGTTPTKDVLDGDWARSGTTVTSTSSTYVLSAPDVGKWIRFADGTKSKIVSVEADDSCTVANSGTVAAQSAILFRCNQTGLTTEVKRTVTYPDYQDQDGSWATTTLFDQATNYFVLRRTYDFTAEGGSVTYTEVGFSHVNTSGANLFSRVLLDVPANLTVGQQLRVRYELQIVTLPAPDDHDERTLAVSGWPRPYAISAIASTATHFTVTLTETHHYVAGGKITIAGADVGAYDGEWTIDSASGADVTVASAIDPGPAGAGGTVVNDTKYRPYRCGWSLQQCRGPNFSGYINPGIAAGGGSSAQNAWFTTNGADSDDPAVGNTLNGLYDPEGTIRIRIKNDGPANTTSPAFNRTDASTTATSGWRNMNHANQLGLVAANKVLGTTVKQAYGNGDFFLDHVVTWSTGIANSLNITTIFFVCSVSDTAAQTHVGLTLSFNERQRKDSTHRLILTVRLSWDRELEP